jgi:hypothetical protein
MFVVGKELPENVTDSTFGPAIRLLLFRRELGLAKAMLASYDVVVNLVHEGFNYHQTCPK